MTDRMRVLDSHLKWCDEISVLLLFFAFVTDEIEINRESLKMTVFQCLESLSWELEICYDCEHKFEDNDFEEMIKSDCCL